VLSLVSVLLRTLPGAEADYDVGSLVDSIRTDLAKHEALRMLLSIKKRLENHDSRIRLAGGYLQLLLYPRYEAAGSIRRPPGSLSFAGPG
jgi:hypothetical protein